MNFESITGDSVSPVTTRKIIYDEILTRGSTSLEDSASFRLPKRGTALAELFLASSILALTTTQIALPNLWLSGPTCLQISDQTSEVGAERSRNITLREACEIALLAHDRFEEGLRRDRIQEARLAETAGIENDA